MSGFDETERRITELGVALSDISLIINTHTHWFKETVDLYFNNEYESTYSDIMSQFIQKGIVIRENGRLSTTVKPQESNWVDAQKERARRALIS